MPSQNPSCTMGALYIYRERERDLFGSRCCCKRYVRVLGRRASSSHRSLWYFTSHRSETKSSTCSAARRWDVRCVTCSQIQLDVHQTMQISSAVIASSSHHMVTWSHRSTTKSEIQRFGDPFEKDPLNPPTHTYLPRIVLGFYLLSLNPKKRS